MGYVTPEQITQAKELDLLTYLQRYDPHELVHVSGSTYCTREHDSLKISNGKWNWFSRGIGGKTALDYLIKVQGFSFTQAVETLVGRAAVLPPISRAAPKPAPPRKLLMPELNSNHDRVLNYLMGRGIHPVVLDYCLEHKLLFETKQAVSPAPTGSKTGDYGRTTAMSHAPATSSTLIGTTRAAPAPRTALPTMWASWRRWRTALSTPWRATPAIAAGRTATP